MRSLQFSMWLPWSLEDSFEFFTDVHKLDQVTPRWFRIRPLSDSPMLLGLGTKIDYEMRWRGWTSAWQSVIRDWRPPQAVAYEQGRGPFRFYRNENHFLNLSGGTLLEEQVFYRAPGGSWVQRFLVEPDLQRIFRFRRSLVGGSDFRRPSTHRHPPADP